MDRLELRLATFGFDGSHYTLTYDADHLPPDYGQVRKSFRAFRARLKRWNDNELFDWLGCIEGRHGDKRLHIHAILRDDDFAAADVRRIWHGGDIDQEPVLMQDGGFRRLAKYFNKERPDGYVIPLDKKPWTGSRGLQQQIPVTERWEDVSPEIRVPDNIVWCRRGNQVNDFGAYYYASYILKER